eukprot:g33122.t1
MSPGPDGIYPRILREATEQIAGVFTDIFVSSLATGEVPEDYKIANVVQLLKKGNRDNPGNYRLSFTSVVRKSLEKILRDRMYTPLEANGLISDKQHGFVHMRLCLTNLIEFVEEVAKMIDEGSVLGPLLFVVYVNDLEETVAGLSSQFADDTKIGGVADSEEDWAVFGALKNIKVNKFPGPDGIYPRILRETKEEI